MLVCINFHYIRPSFELKYPSFFGITPSKFEEQLTLLSTLGTFISSADLAHQVRTGAKPSDDLQFMVTFDDGLKEQFEWALPILEAKNIPAVFYVNTENIVEKKVQMVHKIHLVRSVVSPTQLLTSIDAALDSPGSPGGMDRNALTHKAVEHYKYDDEEVAQLKYYLNFVLDKKTTESIISTLFEAHFDEAQTHDALYFSKDQICALSDKGMIGSHGHQHLPIGMLSREEKKFQIETSQRILEELTGRKADGFSFPYGSKESVSGCSALLQEAGYAYGLSMERAINMDLNQAHALSRFDNNDLPMGKSYNFTDLNLTKNLKSRSWVIQ